LDEAKLYKKAGNKQAFLVTGISGQVFSVRERFLRSWFNNLMALKKRSWSWKNRRSWYCNLVVLLHHW